jgi:hypothetical protein
MFACKLSCTQVSGTQLLEISKHRAILILLLPAQSKNTVVASPEQMEETQLTTPLANHATTAALVLGHHAHTFVLHLILLIVMSYLQSQLMLDIHLLLQKRQRDNMQQTSAATLQTCNHPHCRRGWGLNSRRPAAAALALHAYDTATEPR